LKVSHTIFGASRRDYKKKEIPVWKLVLEGVQCVKGSAAVGLCPETNRKGFSVGLGGGGDGTCEGMWGSVPSCLKRSGGVEIAFRGRADSSMSSQSEWRIGFRWHLYHPPHGGEGSTTKLLSIRSPTDSGELRGGKRWHFSR